MCFLKEDVYIGYSLEDLAKVRQALANEGIKYSYRVHDHSGRAAKGRHGSMELNMKYTKQYTVSVKRKDCEQASYLVNKALRQK